MFILFFVFTPHGYFNVQKHTHKTKCNWSAGVTIWFMWTGLRINYPIVEGPRREKRGREEGEWRKGGGGKIGGRGNEENSARAAPKRGETRNGRHKFTMRIIIKGTRNILTRLAHLNYFFGFILADFTLLTKNSKKKCSHISMYS